MVSALDSRSSDLSSSPGLRRCYENLVKTFYFSSAESFEPVMNGKLEAW